MNWEAIGAIGEVAGATGVILSLLYLAIQIRGEARAKRASTVHDQSNAYRDFLHSLATDDQLSGIYLRGLRDADELDEAELVRFLSALGFLFRVFEEAFYHWNDGDLDDHVWHGFSAPIVDMLAYPGTIVYWEMRRHWYSAPFREFVEKEIERAGEQKLYREKAA
jgi:hypothetical protein